jgi:3',5'-cyclic AMP phosphodiesterase CpdA
MKRRDFVKYLSLFAGGLILSLSLVACKSDDSKSVRFGISTDIHHNIIHDAEKRLTEYLAEMEAQEVDFIIDLGDFCHPVEESEKFAEIWKSSTLEKYNALGNHEMDLGTKADFIQFVGMKNRYYSFDMGDFHFIVLDPNNLKIEGEYIPYENANFYKPGDQRSHVDPEQLEWLKKDLEQTDLTCIVFSHQSFDNEGSSKAGQVREILEEANKSAGFQKVVAAFNGHDHTDYTSNINGIHYVHINSMSYIWVGDNYMYPERFSEEINRKRPNLKKTVPYLDPLFALVTIDENTIRIEGRETSFMPPGPEELGMNLEEMRSPKVPKISDRILSYER